MIYTNSILVHTREDIYMESNSIKIYQENSNKIALKIIPGHFATSHSHVNFYIDMTTLKIRQNEAAYVASSMANDYVTSTIIDTIVCMDGTEIIGAFLAEELSRAGIMSINSHKTMYIITPEFNTNNQLIFRDNIQPAINGKHILLLLASATTGKTIRKCIECIEYYGGNMAGISAIFSAVNQLDNIPIKSLFTTKDLPEYQTYEHAKCPFCKKGNKVDAIVNSYGYLKI